MSGTRNAVLGVGGALLGLVCWQLIGLTGVLGRVFPPLSDVVLYLIDPANATLLGRAISATFTEASLGFAFGVISALVLAVVSELIPMIGPGVGRLSAMVNAAPWIALGPIFAILYRDQTPVIISALAVFFTAFVAVSAGLARSDDRHAAVFSSLGASRARRLVSLQAPGALPALFDGLRLAVPAAMVGAIFGEWFGATRGLGALLVSAMQNLRVEQLWAAATVCAIVSLVGYGVFTIALRMVRTRFA